MRGKTVVLRRNPVRAVDASMRPPQNAGENDGECYYADTDCVSFNEAPAECGGKRRAR